MEERGSARSTVIWTTADLRALGPIRLERSEVIYAYVSLEGGSRELDEALLDTEELLRSQRFVRRSDGCRFVRAHAALRSLLAACLGIDPELVSYEIGAHGKPSLQSGLPPLEFNLSHSGRLGLLAVARDRSVGVDIEHIRELPDALAIAEMHFTATEARRLRSLPLADQSAAFFRYWTRKEAVVKAGGEGLERALDSFDVTGSCHSTLFVVRSLDATKTAEWRARDLPAPAEYMAAGAVAGPFRHAVRWRELSTRSRET